MTITSPTSKAKYVGNGTTTVFSVPFYFFKNLNTTNQLAVYLKPEGSETATLQIEGTDYTVSGADNPSGGFVTFTVAPALNAKITIVRNVPVTQEVAFVEGEDFPADDYEFSLDKITMEIQQIDETLSRTIVVDPTSEADLKELIIAIGKLAADKENIDAVAGDLTNIDAVAGDLTNINITASISAEIKECGIHTTEIVTLYDDLKTGGTGYIQTVSVNITDINTCADNIAAIIAAPDYAALAKQYAVGLPTEPAEYSAKWWAEHAGLNNKGVWNATDTYDHNDMVSIDDTTYTNFYTSQQDNNTGHQPTTSETTWWRFLFRIHKSTTGEAYYDTINERIVWTSSGATYDSTNERINF